MAGNPSRYIYDTLYGQIQLDDWPWGSEINDDFWEYFTCPELQRLREVRLCNINSLFLPGGANINRFEHALGTYYLAKECLRSWPALHPLDPQEKKQFLIAALLHDFKTSAFGHSVEYIEKKEGFQHESEFYEAIQPGITEPIRPNEDGSGSYQYNLIPLSDLYFGSRPKLSTLVDKSDQKVIGDIIQGDDSLGPLISSDMDLDNIDNVFRLAYHIGITDDTSTPLELARCIYVENGQKVVPEKALPLIEKWRQVREQLYRYLLLNPGEFSAKCMFTEAVAFAKREESSLTWKKVDRELIHLLERVRNYQKDDLLVYEFTIDPDALDYLTLIKQRQNTDDVEIELPDEITDTFEEQGFNLAEDTKLESSEDRLWIVEQSKNRRFELRDHGDYVQVYREATEIYQTSNILSRLMKGDLYGCLAIVSVSGGNLESLNVIFTKFNSIDGRLELARELSEKLPENLWQRRIQTRFHAIRDVAKTRRPVSVQLETGENREIGDMSQRILIGVFAANRNLSIYDVDDLSSEQKLVIEEDAVEFISKVANEIDTGLKVKSLELYGEAKNA